jgi:putative oxidoreductase
VRLTIDDTPTRLERIGSALPRVGLALVFMAIGSSKFAASSGWIGVFDRIGWGQWFRYFAGVMQLGGALLLLMRRTALVGATLIACTMAGAIYFDLFVLRVGVAAAIPLVLLVMAIAVGLQSYFNRE